MLNNVFEKVHKGYKRAFKKHHDKLYQTVQSKPVRMEGSTDGFTERSTYVLVGEMRLKESVLPSHFDVFDEVGESVDEIVGQSVHTFLARITLIEEMRRLREYLRHVVNIQGSDVTNHLTIKQEADVVYLTEKIEVIMVKLTSLIERVDQITRKPVLDSDDLHGLENDWNAFWELYEKRMRALIYVYTHNKAPKKNGIVKDLWEEAKFVATLYRSLAPLPHETDIATFDELITHTYQFGRLRQHDLPLEQANKGERMLPTFISILFWMGLFLFTVVTLVLVVEGEFGVGDGVRMGAFLLLAIFLRKQTKTRLLSKNNAYLAELRARPVNRESIKEVYEPSVSENR